MLLKQTNRLITLGVLALASSATAGQIPDQVGWSAQVMGKAWDSGQAIVMQGDGELDSRRGKMATYRLHMSARVEGHKRLVLFTSLEAIESGGNHTVLRLPTKRTVLYTAPDGMALAEASTSLPPMLQMQSGAAFASTGGQEFMNQRWSSNPREFGVIFGDKWGSDINALQYYVQLAYRVRLVNITYPRSSVSRAVHPPSRPRFGAPRRRHR